MSDPSSARLLPQLAQMSPPSAPPFDAILGDARNFFASAVRQFEMVTFRPGGARARAMQRMLLS
jgi:hypothetical protein